MTARHDGIPVILQHHLKHNQVLHEQVILLTVIIEEIPRVPLSKRVEVTKLDQGFFRVVMHFGFMESPNVPQALGLSQKYNLTIETDHVTYYIGRQTIVPNPQGGAMALWRKVLFVFLAHNAAQPITFYHLSLEQVFELGNRVEF
jgi:KUP system potassium uptake protein